MYAIFVTITCAIVVGLLIIFLAWLLPFGLLVHRLKHHHPRYFVKLGRPYNQSAYVDVPQRNDKRSASPYRSWWRCLGEVYRGVPRTFLRDKRCQRLARLSRRALRLFIPLALVFLCVMVPIDSFVLVLNRQPPVTITGVSPSNKQVVNQSASGGGTTVSVSSGSTQHVVTRPNQSTSSVTQTTTTIEPLAKNPETSPAFVTQPPTTQSQQQGTALTRADLTSTFSSIAPAGQQRTRKRDVCQQLTSNSPVESNLGPSTSSDDICTNTNLLTYSAY